MEPMSARAFLASILKRSGRQDILDTIRGYERSLPQGRYLRGSEISQYLVRIGNRNPKNKVEINDPTEAQVDAMDALWKQYEREVIWPGEQFEDQLHGEVIPLSQAEKVHRWEDWACERLGLMTVSAK